MKSPILLGAVLCGVFTSLVPTANAATKTWTGGSSAQWSAPGNWLNGDGPLSGDDLVFPANATRFATTNNIVGRRFRSITISGNNYILSSSPGILTCSNVTFGGASSDFTVELNGITPGTGHDQLDARGTVSVGSCTLNVTVGGGFVPAIGQIFTLLNNDGTDPIPTRFAGLPEGAPVPVGAYEFTISYVGGSGNDITLAVTHVPEPLRIVEILVGGGNLTVTFQTIAGRTYHVEKTPSLAPPNWQDISGPLIATGPTTIFTTPAPAGPANCFFQIVSP